MWLIIVGLLIVFVGGMVAGLLVVVWTVGRLRVTVEGQGEPDVPLWVASPHGPVRAPTEREMQWAREHPGEQLPYIPGDARSDPYLAKERGP